MHKIPTAPMASVPCAHRSAWSTKELEDVRGSSCGVHGSRSELKGSGSKKTAAQMVSHCRIILHIQAKNLQTMRCSNFFNSLFQGISQPTIGVW